MEHTNEFMEYLSERLTPDEFKEVENSMSSLQVEGSHDDLGKPVKIFHTRESAPEKIHHYSMGLDEMVLAEDSALIAKCIK